MLNVFDVQFSSYHDGPGIRTVIFLKGCNLSCLWCQNPESQKVCPELLHFDNLCIRCGKCVDLCPHHCFSVFNNKKVFNRDLCDACGVCVDNCVSESLQLTGRKMLEGDILDEIMRDADIYKLSGGGITVSGGEPLLQADSVAELFRLAKAAEINTAIETAGCVNPTELQKVKPYLDYALFDIKTLDKKKHMEFCGGSNRFVDLNLKMLEQNEITTHIRVPIIPGFNDTPEDVETIAKYSCGFSQITEIQLLPFHKLGAGKYTALDRTYGVANIETPSSETMENLRRIVDKAFYARRKE